MSTVTTAHTYHRGRHPTRRRTALSLVITAALGLTACGGGGSSTADSNNFVVGAVIPLSGLLSALGNPVQAGMQVAVDQMNRNGGILGKQVKLTVRDSGSDPKTALAAAKSLTQQDRVDFLYADIYSADALAILPYTTSNQIFTMTNGATPKLGDPSEFPYNFQYLDVATSRGPAVGAGVAEVASKLHTGNKVGLLVANSPAEKATADSSVPILEKAGLTVVGTEEFTGNPTDLSPQLSKLRAAGADVIELDVDKDNGVQAAMTSLQTLGWTAPVVADPVALHGNLLAQVPAAVRSQFYALNYVVSTRTTAGIPTNVKPFADAVLGKTKEISGLGYAAAASAALYLAKWTYETAQKSLGATDSKSLMKTLEGISKVDYKPTDNFGDLFLSNPNYTPQQHNTSNADYSHFWALVTPSENVAGTYVGTPFDFGR